MTVWSKGTRCAPYTFGQDGNGPYQAPIGERGLAPLCGQEHPRRVQDIDIKRVCRMAQSKPAPASLCWMSRVRAIAEYFRPIH